MVDANIDVLAVIRKYREEIRNEWEEGLTAQNVGSGRAALVDLKEQMFEFLNLLQQCPPKDPSGFDHYAWQAVRRFLEEFSRVRVSQGFSSEQTATFVFSLKKPLFTQIRKEFGHDSDSLASATWAITEIVDQLGLYTVAAFQKTREDVIGRQQMELLELSTPVVKLWDGILALPMIGTLDSARTQLVMESLLQRIVETGAEIAIIDITGVPTVDTLVAQHLLKTVTAIRLMGADCIISGIRPQIAQTVVHLGVDLQDVTTKASLADALSLAMKRSGFSITKKSE